MSDGFQGDFADNAIGVGLRPKNIGARVKRVEDPRLLTGEGHYADDSVTPGALHLALRRSDQSHARITTIGTAEAAAIPGVHSVLTAQDIAGWVEPMRATSRMKDYKATPISPLAAGKVRFVGEPVCAILAENRYIAEDAAELIDIEFETLGTVINPEEAHKPGAPLLHEEAGTNVILRREFARGDAPTAMAQAAVRVGGRFRFRRKSPLAIEPRSYVAEFDRGRRSLTLTSSTQIPGIVRDELSALLGIPGHSIRVVAPDVGGGFGGKGSLYQEEVLTALLASRLGRSVRWTSDRLEDLTSTSQGFDEIAFAELGLDAEGRIVALTADVIGDVGAYSIFPWTAAL